MARLRSDTDVARPWVAIGGVLPVVLRVVLIVRNGREVFRR
ncbi:MAG TPA: hypothetical protein VGE52_19950 [Pirellulales bacterium]